MTDPSQYIDTRNWHDGTVIVHERNEYPPFSARERRRETMNGSRRSIAFAHHMIL